MHPDLQPTLGSASQLLRKTYGGGLNFSIDLSYAVTERSELRLLKSIMLTSGDILVLR